MSSMSYNKIHNFRVTMLLSLLKRGNLSAELGVKISPIFQMELIYLVLLTDIWLISSHKIFISDAGDILIGDSHGNKFHVVVFANDGTLLGEFECPHVKVRNIGNTKNSQTHNLGRHFTNLNPFLSVMKKGSYIYKAGQEAWLLTAFYPGVTLFGRHSILIK